MKGWRDRRKAKEQALAQAESFANPEPQVNSTFGKSMRRKQRNVPEQRPEINLTTALPDTNDFRMSLMMPAFSARFSMLREQDNPETKIGKAADDSVLFPKRASRMNLFSHNPLTDIAEVDSIHSSFKPPFADGHRSHSFSDGGYASDDGGSIMGRSKPGEGNNLFGGRQKMYRIPASKTGESDGASMGGRHMYEGDVSMSMFQKLRMEARQGRESEDTNERPESIQLQHTDTEEVDTINSPSTGFSKNRGTTSSTTSAPSNRRTSTAATSVASESPAMPQNIASANISSKSSDQNSALDRNSTLHKRLYAANLDQVSPSRRNFKEISDGAFKPTAASNANPKLMHSLSQSRSASNLGEKYKRSNQVFTASSYGSASPPSAAVPPAMPPTDLAPHDGKRSASPSDARQNMRTPGSEEEDVMNYVNHVQPNDRGKATAMGLFHRPQRQYDEHQFSQRQLQMVEGRNSPAPRAESRSSEAVSRHVSGELHDRSSNSRKNTMPKSKASPILCNDSETERRASPLMANFPEPSPPITGRLRTKSIGTSNAAATVKARAEELIRRQNAELAAIEAHRQIPRTSAPMSKRQSPSTQLARKGTFLDTFDASDEESDPTSRHPSSRQSQPKRSPGDVHPAFRDGGLDFDFGDAVSRSRSNASASNEENYNSSSSSITALPQKDYNTYETLPAIAHGSVAPAPLNAIPGQGLSGMIRSHMRDTSSASSIYAPPSPTIPTHSSTDTLRAGPIGSTARAWNPPESVHSDPWDLDQSNNDSSSGHRGSQPGDQATQMAQRAQQKLGHNTATREKSKAQQILGDEAPLRDERPAVGSSWQEANNRAMHHRGASTETQKERDEFDSQLAERRRKVQERMKNAVDDVSQDPSTGPFSALKPKSSKTSLHTKSGEPSSKAMKMLGISSPPPRMPSEPYLQEEEERATHDFGRRPKQRSPEESYEHQRRSEPRDRSAARSGRSTPHDEERARQRSATPSSGRTSRGDGRRDRSNSAASSRSRSRQGGRHRDEPEPAMPGAFPNLPYGDVRFPEMNAPPRRPSAPQIDPSQYERSGSATANRNFSSNGRPPPADQFERRRGPPLLTGTIPSGQPMRSARPNLSADDPAMPFPRDILDYPQHSSQSTTVELQKPFRHSPPTEQVMPSPRRAPIPDYSTRRPSSPSLYDYSANNSAGNSPAVSSYPSNGRVTPGGTMRKKSISKHMISEPTFVSSTSSVPLVNRSSPDGPSVPPPELPAMNPRRRGQATTPTGTIFGSFGSNKTKSREIQPNGYPFTDEDPEYRPALEKRQRNRLRKSSSEGGSMAAKAAKQAMMTGHLESPGMPTFPNRSATNLPRDDGMF